MGKIKKIYNAKVDKLTYVLVNYIFFILQGLFIYNIEKIFPKKYFFDSYKIINAINLKNYDEFGKSYKLTIKLFSILRFDELRTYNITLFFILLIALIPYLSKLYNEKLYIFLYNFLFLFLISVYLIRPGKEILQFIMLFFCYRWPKMIAIFLIVGGLVFRKYLILQGIIYILLKYLLKNKKKGIVLIVLGIIILSLKAPILIEKILNIREITNRNRMNSEYAKTIILSLIKGKGIVIMYMNYIFNTIRLLFPFELLLKGVKYFPYILFQTWISKRIIRPKNRKSEGMLLLYSFIIVSGIFEPDFGSFLRHLVPYMIFIKRELI